MNKILSDVHLWFDRQLDRCCFGEVILDPDEKTAKVMSCMIWILMILIVVLMPIWLPCYGVYLIGVSIGEKIKKRSVPQILEVEDI